MSLLSCDDPECVIGNCFSCRFLGDGSHFKALWDKPITLVYCNFCSRQSTVTATGCPCLRKQLDDGVHWIGWDIYERESFGKAYLAEFLKHSYNKGKSMNIVIEDVNKVDTTSNSVPLHSMRLGQRYMVGGSTLIKTGEFQSVLESDGTTIPWCGGNYGIPLTWGPHGSKVPLNKPQERKVYKLRDIPLLSVVCRPCNEKDIFAVVKHVNGVGLLGLFGFYAGKIVDIGSIGDFYLLNHLTFSYK